MGGSCANPEAKEALALAAASPADESPVVPAGAQPASSERLGLSDADELATRDGRTSINRRLIMMQDHLAELDARLA
ncbi:MAG: hypothetical protein ACRED2_10490, partial [Methylocella sp.]